MRVLFVDLEREFDRLTAAFPASDATNQARS